MKKALALMCALLFSSFEIGVFGACGVYYAVRHGASSIGCMESSDTYAKGFEASLASTSFTNFFWVYGAGDSTNAGTCTTTQNQARIIGTAPTRYAAYNAGGNWGNACAVGCPGIPPNGVRTVVFVCQRIGETTSDHKVKYALLSTVYNTTLGRWEIGDVTNGNGRTSRWVVPNEFPVPVVTGSTNKGDGYYDIQLAWTPPSGGGTNGNMGFYDSLPTGQPLIQSYEIYYKESATAPTDPSTGTWSLWPTPASGSSTSISLQDFYSASTGQVYFAMRPLFYYGNGPAWSPPFVGANSLPLDLCSSLTVDVTPQDETFACAGSQMIFSASPSGGVAPYTYQWVENGVDISGATASSYSATKAAAGTFTYNCKVTDGSGYCTGITDTADSTGTWLSPPSSVDVTPNGTTTACTGMGILFSATVTGGSGHIYQWTENGVDIPGAIDSTLTVSKFPDGTFAYNCKVQSGGCGTQLQDAVSSTGRWVAPALQIDVLPDGATASCVGLDIVFSAVVAGGAAPFSYQWTENGVDIPGATYSTCIASKGAVGTFTYNCKVTESTSCIGQDAIASAGYWVTSPAVDVTPSGETLACVEDSITFTAGASGGTAPYSYQWSENGVDIPGATDSTCTVTKTSTGTFSYNCKVNSSGCATQGQDGSPSTGAWVAPPAAASVTPNGTVSACTGMNIAFAVTVTGGTNLRYQWTENGSDISGATNSSYISNKVEDGTYSYNCKVTSYGCGTQVQDASSSAGKWASPPSDVDVVPDGTSTTCTGAGITFTASITGGTPPYVYQWTENGGPIFGATGSTYTAAKTSASSFTYNCLVYSQGCFTQAEDAWSSTGSWVETPAVNVTPDGETTVCNGSGITFSAYASGGTAPYAYQWTENGASIAGATGASFTVSKASAGAFTYNCLVSSSGCAAQAKDAAGPTGSWIVCAPSIIYHSSGPFYQLTGNGDQYFDRGEKWSVQVTVANTGNIPATGVTASLAGNEISVCSNPGIFGTIPVGGTATFTYEFVISAAFSPCGGQIGFDLTNKTSFELAPAGADEMDRFNVTVGLPGEATELVIQPSSADSYINASATGTNYGSATTAQVNSRSATKATRALVQFDLSGIPAGSTINSATLELYCTSVPGTQVQLDAHHITSAWTEPGVTWASAPSFSASADAVNPGTLSTGWKSWSMTDVVQSWTGGSYPNNGLIIMADNENTGSNNIYQFATKEYATAAEHPVLRVNYTPPVDCGYVGSGACPSCEVSVDVVPDGTISVGVGASITFTVAASGGEGPYAYQWTRDGIDIGGSTGSNLTESYGTTQSHTYNCRVTAYGCATPGQDATWSTGVWLPVSPPPEVPAQSWYDKETPTWEVVLGATGYRLQRGLRDSLPSLLDQSEDSCNMYDGPDSTTTAAEDPASLADGDFYWYLVIAYNAGGEGPAGDATESHRVVNSSGACP